jgi:hypothetical protein
MERNREFAPKGIYHDTLVARAGNVIDFGWRSNVIVDRCRELIASFMKGDAPAGIQFLAVGRGDSNWDTDPPPSPSPSTQQLADSSPVVFNAGTPALEIEFLGPDGNPVPGPTSRIEVTATIDPGTLPLAPGETTYPLREFGLFGDLGGTDFMIDYVRHPVMHIAATDTLRRRIRLVF